MDSPLYTTKNNGDVPYLDAVMVECDDGSLSLFAVNKSLEDDITLSCDLRQYEGFRVERHIVLDHDDMKAENTEEHPDTVAPKSNGSIQYGKRPPFSGAEEAFLEYDPYDHTLADNRF